MPYTSRRDEKITEIKPSVFSQEKVLSFVLYTHVIYRSCIVFLRPECHLIGFTIVSSFIEVS